MNGTIFGREPVLIATAIRTVILCATAFGLEWTADQVAAVMLAVEAILTAVTRQAVTAPATLEAAGTSKAELVQQAEANKGN